MLLLASWLTTSEGGTTGGPDTPTASTKGHPMTEPTTTPAPTLVISERLSDLLLWLLDANEIDVAKEVIEKPWQWEDLAQVHAAHPDLDADDALDALPRLNS